VGAAEISLPEGCTDDPCGYETSLERCTRTYVCSSTPGVCVTAYDCACVDARLACGSTEVPPDVCD
jgi:hypothetical protein